MKELSKDELMEVEGGEHLPFTWSWDGVYLVWGYGDKVQIEWWA